MLIPMWLAFLLVFITGMIAGVVLATVYLFSAAKNAIDHKKVKETQIDNLVTSMLN